MHVGLSQIGGSRIIGDSMRPQFAQSAQFARRLDRGIQSATDMLPYLLKKGATVLHKTSCSFNCPPCVVGIVFCSRTCFKCLRNYYAPAGCSGVIMFARCPCRCPAVSMYVPCRHRLTHTASRAGQQLHSRTKQEVKVI